MYLISRLKIWSQRKEETEKRFKQVLNHSRDIIYQLDIESGKYRYISPSIVSITGYDVKHFTEEGVQFVLGITHPDDLERMKAEVIDYGDPDIEEKLRKDNQFRIKRKDGEYIWINNKRSLLRDEQGNPTAIIGNVRDISERKKYVEALDQSLKEKEMLLSEIHHRVKNNLSIVSSLVELQKSKAGQGSSEGFKEIQSRIKSIALVHEKLYHNKNFTDVNLAEYISELVDLICKTYDSSVKEITVHHELDDLHVNIKRAVPIALICNELINNCYKYAFEEEKNGRIDILLKVRDGKAVLSVSDNGTGLPNDFEERKADSLGMTLISVFTRQIQGKLKYTNNNGTVFEIELDV
jgi:PAS domain S-box-containing protein